MTPRFAASRLAAAALPALLGLLVLSVASAAPASSLQAASSGQRAHAAELSVAQPALGLFSAQLADAELSVGPETRVRGSTAETNVGAWVFSGASAGLHPGKLRWPAEIAEGAVFRYEHGGRRIAASGPSGSRSWLWSGDDVVEEEQAGTARVYERAGGLVLGFAAVDTSNYSVLGHESFVTDGLGSVVARVPDVPGAIAWHRYDAWGVFRLGAANDGTAPGAAGATLYGAEGRACLTCPQRFTAPGAGMSSPAYAGQYWDADAGLSYAEQRWYAPEIGSFLSQDPYEGSSDDAPSLHRFGYAHGAPLRFWDPSGYRALREAESEYVDTLRRKLAEQLAEYAEKDLASRIALMPRMVGLEAGVDSHLTKLLEVIDDAGENEDVFITPMDRPDGTGPALTMVGAKDKVEPFALLSEISTMNPEVRAMRMAKWESDEQKYLAPWETFHNLLAPRGGTANVAKRGIRASGKRAPAVALLPYSKGKGHHTPAKSAFRDAENYDPAAAPAVPKNELRRLGIDHDAVSGAQQTGYRALALRGEKISWENMATIERRALEKGGLDPKAAASTVARAIASLKDQGVAEPTRIPWGDD